MLDYRHSFVVAVQYQETVTMLSQTLTQHLVTPLRGYKRAAVPAVFVTCLQQQLDAPLVTQGSQLVPIDSWLPV